MNSHTARRSLIGIAVTMSLAALTLVLLGPLGRQGSASSALTDNVEVRESFAALSRPAKAGDDPPDSTARMLVGASDDVDRSAIRAFATPMGNGYLIPHQDRLCIALPDPVDGFGTTCSPWSAAAKSGVAVMMFASENWRHPTTAIVLPRGASASAVSKEGSRTPMAADDDGIIFESALPLVDRIDVTAPDGSTAELVHPARVAPPTAPGLRRREGEVRAPGPR